MSFSSVSMFNDGNGLFISTVSSGGSPWRSHPCSLRAWSSTTCWCWTWDCPCAPLALSRSSSRPRLRFAECSTRCRGPGPIPRSDHLYSTQHRQDTYCSNRKYWMNLRILILDIFLYFSKISQLTFITVLQIFLMTCKCWLLYLKSLKCVMKDKIKLKLCDKRI